MPLSFSWTLDVGQVMNIVAIVAGVIWAIATVRTQLSDAQERIGGVELELKKLSEVVISNARLEERLTAALLRITALETRGRQGG